MTITITGLAGHGKTQIGHIIATALAARGVDVTFVDEVGTHGYDNTGIVIPASNYIDYAVPPARPKVTLNVMGA